MRKLYSILLVILSLLFTACNSEKAEEHSNDEASAPEYMQLEWLKTRNPNTNQVEREKLWNYIFSQRSTLGETKTFSKAKIYPSSWRPIDDFFANLAVQRIVYNPNNTLEMYFCTGEGWNNAEAARGAGVFKSVNGGETWTQLPSTLSDTFWYCHDMVVHPITSDIYVATRAAGIQRSQDGGSTWQSVLNSGNGSLTNRSTDIELTADNELVVCFGNFSTDGVYFSSTGDEGDWERRMNGMSANNRRIELATAPSNANVMYAIPTSSSAIDSNRINGIYRTDDKGLNWTAVSLPDSNRELSKKQGWYDLIVQVSPEDENTVLVGGLNVYRTKDGGKTWQQMFEGDRRKHDTPFQYVHVDQHEIVFKSQDTVLLGNDGGIYRCDNIQADTPYFYDINNNYNVTQYYSCAIDDRAGSSFIIGGTQDNGSSGSQGEGISEFRQLSWADGSYCNIDHQDGDIFYTTTQYRRIYRNNHGKIDTLTNAELRDDSLRIEYTLFINPIEMDPNDPNLLYQLSNRGLWRLNNARTATKDDWQKASRNFGTYSAIGIAKDVKNMVFLGRSSGGAVFRIENANTAPDNYLPINCDPEKYLPDAYCNNVFVNPKDANHVLAVYSNYGVESIWESKNALSSSPTWASQEGNLPDIPVRWSLIHPENDKICYVGTEAGVFMTTNLDGQNTVWKATNDGLANLKVNMLRIRENDKTIIAATHGRGLYEGKINDDFTVTWKERGPNNVGGRTRTMMFDPNDPSGKKLWAGSVSGGLWVANNYDSIKVFNYSFQEDLNIKVGPNPVVGDVLKIFVETKSNRQIKFEMFDITGRKIKSDNLDVVAGENIYAMSTATCLSNATYLLRFTNGEYIKVFKVIIL